MFHRRVRTLGIGINLISSGRLKMLKEENKWWELNEERQEGRSRLATPPFPHIVHIFPRGGFCLCLCLCMCLCLCLCFRFCLCWMRRGRKEGRGPGYLRITSLIVAYCPHIMSLQIFFGADFRSQIVRSSPGTRWFEALRWVLWRMRLGGWVAWAALLPPTVSRQPPPPQVDRQQPPPEIDNNNFL